MKSSEVWRWCFRHRVTIEFQDDNEVIFSWKDKKNKLIVEAIKLRNHGYVPDQIARFITKLSSRLYME